MGLPRSARDFFPPQSRSQSHPLLFVDRARSPGPRSRVREWIARAKPFPPSSAFQASVAVGDYQLRTLYFPYSSFVYCRFKRCVAFLFFVEGLFILMVAVARLPGMHRVQARDGRDSCEDFRRDLQPKWSTMAFAPAAGSCRSWCPFAHKLHGLVSVTNVF
ncbi:hypothetical protein MTO96_016535 [Rhipicephalus appendiculatus]